jgi:hypothetical protein
VSGAALSITKAPRSTPNEVSGAALSICDRPYHAARSRPRAIATHSLPRDGICLHRKNKSPPFLADSGSASGSDEGIWLATFIDYDLGYIDLEQSTLQTPSLSPFS